MFEHTEEGSFQESRPAAETKILPRQSPGFDEPEPQAETKKAIAIEGTALFEHSPQIDQMFGALAEAQGKIVQPLKSKMATVMGETKAGKPYQYNYWYCDISDVLNACLGPFSQSGIAQMQFPTIEEYQSQGKPAAMVHVRTVLGHKSGQWISCTLRAVADSMGPQALGSVITYLRRYGLQLLGGIAADEDEDGGAGQGNQAGGAGGTNPALPMDPQRSGEGKTTWETVTNVLEYSPKPTAQAGKMKYNVKLQGIGKDGADAWASTLDKVLGEKIGREVGTGIQVRVQLKRVQQYIDLVGGSTVPPTDPAANK